MLAGRRGLGDPAGAQDRIERRGLSSDRPASRIEIAVTDGCAQSPSPSPSVRTRSPQAVDRPIVRAVPGSGSLAQVAPPSTRCLGDAPLAGRSAGADRNDRARDRDDVGDRAETAGSGSSTSVQARSGGGRRRRMAGGASLGEATATGVGAAEAAGVASVGATVASRRPATRKGERHDDSSQGPGEAAPAVEMGHARGTPLEPGA